MKRVCFALLLSGLTVPVFASASAHFSWIETLYYESYNEYTRNLNSFTVEEDNYYEWYAETGYAANYFKVTGTADQTPPTAEPSWRLRFQHLADNAWTYHEDFGALLYEDQVITNKEKYYIRAGTNTFQDGGSTATRYLDERMTMDLWWIIEPPSGGGGGAG